MFRRFRALIDDLLADDFDDRELASEELPGVKAGREIRYNWEGECPDFLEEMDIEEIEDAAYSAFGYAQVFKPFNREDCEEIANWLAEDGIAFVDTINAGSNAASISSWLQGFAHAKGKQFEEVREGAFLIGDIEQDDDRVALQKIWDGGGCDREQMD